MIEKVYLIYVHLIKGKIVPDNVREAELFKSQNEGKCLMIKRVTELRTDPQNNAMHKYFELVAEALNDAGLPMKKVLERSIDIKWDKDSVKEVLWRNIQKAILKKKSTTQLKKQEDIDKVYDHLNRFLFEEFHIHIPFPNDETKNDKIKVENYPEYTGPTAF